MTLPDWRWPMLRGVSSSRIRIGSPRLAMRRICSASGSETAPAGIGAHALGEAHHAGVRVAVHVGADRADDDRRRALAAGDGRPFAARPPEIAVARPVLGLGHRMVDEDDLAAHRRVRRGDQRVERVEHHHLGLDPRRRRRAAVAERGDRQRLRERRGDRRFLLAAHPHRHVEGLDPDIGEAERAQLGHRPSPRPRFRLGPAEPRADLGGQPLGDVPGDLVLERGVAQVRDVAGHRRHRRGGLGEERSGSCCGEQRGEQALDHRPRLAKPRRRCHRPLTAAAAGRPAAARTGRCEAGIWPGAGRSACSRSRSGCGAARPRRPARASG